MKVASMSAWCRLSSCKRAVRGIHAFIPLPAALRHVHRGLAHRLHSCTEGSWCSTFRRSISRSLQASALSSSAQISVWLLIIELVLFEDITPDSCTLDGSRHHSLSPSCKKKIKWHHKRNILSVEKWGWDLWKSWPAELTNLIHVEEVWHNVPLNSATFDQMWQPFLCRLSTKNSRIHMYVKRRFWAPHVCIYLCVYEYWPQTAEQAVEFIHLMHCLANFIGLYLMEDEIPFCFVPIIIIIFFFFSWCF